MSSKEQNATMISQTFIISLTLVLGIVSGWVGGTWFQGRTTRSAVALFDDMRLADFKTRADEAYRAGTSEIAIWELEHLAAQMTNNTGRISISKSARLELFLVNARLVRLYNELNKTNLMHIAFQNATNYYNGDYPKARIEDIRELLTRINQFDQTTRIQRSHLEPNP